MIKLYMDSPHISTRKLLTAVSKLLHAVSITLCVYENISSTGRAYNIAKESNTHLEMGMKHFVPICKCCIIGAPCSLPLPPPPPTSPLTILCPPLGSSFSSGTPVQAGARAAHPCLLWQPTTQQLPRLACHGERGPWWCTVKGEWL